ncbi:MAG TPA: MBL fold metallo-hydrolase [Ktedonobacteraceae bacterium]|nr:MBL fold metallo-hydrolase [Ktedonobacteraceae bacterium]
MPSPKEIIPVFEMSTDERVRVFRRTFHGINEFEGMEVDAYIVITDRHVIILDTLLCPEDVSVMLDSVKGELRGRSLLCIDSHADWDHSWGNCYFTGENAAPIIAHDHCLTRLKSTEAHVELLEFQQLSSTFKNVFLLPPTITFDQHFTIHGGNLTIELFHAPGHHFDQIVAWLPELRLLLAFDAVENPLPLIEGVDCVPHMFTTLEHLIALQPLRVLCSHGMTTSPDQVLQNLAYVHEIERRCKSVLQKRQPGAQELVQTSELINYSLDEVICETTGTVDRVFYTKAHENNCQAIMKWLMNVP